MHAVDLPAVDDTDLTSASEQYLSALESRPCHDEWFQSQTSKVAITTDNVRRLQLFEDNQPDCTLLALHPPDDPTQVVALHLHEKWWCVGDVLRTSSKSRIGLMLVQSIMERVIVFLLSQVVERCSQEEVLFSLHPRTESCKLLWRDGQAVGFYSVKHKGSLCDGWSSRCYLLPVLDTVLVRRSWRRRGLGLHMLHDFCSSYSTDSFLGISSPLSPGMVAVVRTFLQQHQGHRERLYEVEAPGDWSQRRNIWLNIQLGRYSLSIKEERSRSTSGEAQRKEGADSSPEMHTSTCRPDLTSPSTCSVSIPLATGSTSEHHIETSDPSQGGSSPSREAPGTGCSSDVDPVAPTRPTLSLNTTQATAKPSLSAAQPRTDKPMDDQRRAKRVRRT